MISVKVIVKKFITKENMEVARRKSAKDVIIK